MSDLERVYWVGYFNYKHSIEEEQREKAEKKASSSESNPFAPTPLDTDVNGPTMGRTN